VEGLDDLEDLGEWQREEIASVLGLLVLVGEKGESDTIESMVSLSGEK
jgi:hypothetical protein